MKNKLLLIFLMVSMISFVSSLQLIVYPDMQNYPLKHSNTFYSMNDWVINNSQDNIVLFVGDLVQGEDQGQWNVINNTLNNFNKNNITWLISWGNHDIETGVSYDKTQEIQDDVVYHLTNESIGIITLPYEPSDSDILLTREILSNNSNYTFIVLTHKLCDYLFCPDYSDIISRLNSSNIFMTISGHETGNKVNITSGNGLINILAGHNKDGRFTPAIETEGVLTIIDIDNPLLFNVTTYGINKDIVYLRYEVKNLSYSENETKEYFNNETNETENITVEIIKYRLSSNYTKVTANRGPPSTSHGGGGISSSSGGSGGGTTKTVENIVENITITYITIEKDPENNRINLKTLEDQESQEQEGFFNSLWNWIKRIISRSK